VQVCAEQSLGQAAEVGLLERFLAREDAQFPVNEPPAGDRKNANSVCQRIGRAIHPEVCVRQRDLVRTLPVPDSWAKEPATRFEDENGYRFL
jgi:hypothetical protein